MIFLTINRLAIVTDGFQPNLVHPTAAEIADAVWDETTAGHTTAGTFGNHVGKKLLSVAKFIGLK